MKLNIGKRQIYKNILMNLISFAVQFIIGFYISPIIVKKAGAAAYGFIGVANDFVSYASILATIFNSVASRFIAKEYYSKDYQKANNYFNSLLLANVLLSAFFGFLSIFLVPILDTILSIPIELVWDVKITFALIFASYIVSLVTSVFTVSTFITNRTDIQGIRNIINYVVRLALIIIFLNFQDWLVQASAHQPWYPCL